MAKYDLSTVEGRRSALKDKLQKHKNKVFWCPSLGCHVKVLSRSIDETANWAAASMVGYQLALRLPEVVHGAKVLETGITPKSGKQSKRFKFIELATLKHEIDGLGAAKLTVGYRRNGGVIEYCITEFQGA